MAWKGGGACSCVCPPRGTETPVVRTAPDSVAPLLDPGTRTPPPSGGVATAEQTAGRGVASGGRQAPDAEKTPAVPGQVPTVPIATTPPGGGVATPAPLPLGGGPSTSSADWCRCKCDCVPKGPPEELPGKPLAQVAAVHQGNIPRATSEPWREPAAAPGGGGVSFGSESG